MNLWIIGKKKYRLGGNTVMEKELRNIDKQIIKACKYHYDDNKYISRFEALRGTISEYTGTDIKYQNDQSVYFFLYDLVFKIVTLVQLRWMFSQMYRWGNETYNMRGMSDKLMDILCELAVKDDEGNVLLDLEIREE
jgi:hypothetical protein